MTPTTNWNPLTLDALIERAEAARKVLGGSARVVLETRHGTYLEDAMSTYRADWPGMFVVSFEEDE